MKKIMKDTDNEKTLKEGKPVDLTEHDFETIYDVQIRGDTIPCPINTRPHGFCFDKCHENIWFTGKLTNTVGRIGIDGTRLQHFELPTLGAVPIYITLGNDNNIWGTCLTSSIIFRVTTGKNPVVDELPISDLAKDRKPIVIKPDPRERPFMWFSTEAGHSVCRLDTNVFQEEVLKLRSFGKTGNCTCSLGCKFLFSGCKVSYKIITEFPIPKVNRHMKLGGLAITKAGSIWTQSYMDPAENTIEDLPDYVLRLRFDKHFPTSTYLKERKNRVNMTGVPIDYYELPTKNTVLHRISVAPDIDESVWFTELAADRLGTIKFRERVFTKREKEENNDDGERKKARTH
jgi:virginiamycin B lyase